jgi:hypothetical protein
MPVLFSDARVHGVALRDNGEPLVSLTFAPAVLVRTGSPSDWSRPGLRCLRVWTCESSKGTAA